MFGGSLAVTTEDLKNGIIACSPAIIFIVVVLIAVLIVVAAAGKLKQPKRALVRAQAPIAILLAVTLSVNWVILGVEYSVVNSVLLRTSMSRTKQWHPAVRLQTRSHPRASFC